MIPRDPRTIPGHYRYLAAIAAAKRSDLLLLSGVVVTIRRREKRGRARGGEESAYATSRTRFDVARIYRDKYTSYLLRHRTLPLERIVRGSIKVFTRLLRKSRAQSHRAFE